MITQKILPYIVLACVAVCAAACGNGITIGSSAPRHDWERIDYERIIHAANTRAAEEGI